MANHFPVIPNDFTVNEINYDFKIDYDTAQFGVQFGMMNFSVDYSFIRQHDDGTIYIDSSEFDQDAVEAGVQEAVTQICGMISGFTGAELSDIFPTVKIIRTIWWSSPTIINIGDSQQPAVSTATQIPFVPVTS